MMPKLYVICGYQVSIWSNENGEPIHVHISKKRPTAHSPKMWITSKGTFTPTDDCKRRVPTAVLNRIISELTPNIPDIITFWKGYHGYIRYIDK